MNEVNPKYVLRNYMAQLAIDEADKGDYGLIDELFQILNQLYNNDALIKQIGVEAKKYALHNISPQHIVKKLSDFYHYTNIKL